MTAFGRIVVPAILFSCAMAPPAAQPQGYFAYIGSYTNTTSRGIYVSEFDPAAGTLTQPRLVAETVYPTQVWAAPGGRFLYAANWQGADGIAGDTISAYAVDRATGALTFLNRVHAGGSGPNQVVVDPKGEVAVAVNYRSGSVAAFALGKDGRISEAFSIDQHDGEPRPPSKQPGPRAHGVVFSGDGRQAFVADIGLDRVYGYAIDAGRREMTPMSPPYVTLPAGSGPRRLQLHPGGRFLYVNRETDSMVTVFALDRGRLTEIQTLPTLPGDYKGGNTTAEILIHPGGRHLYVSNRGHGSIAVYAIDRAGRLSLVEHAASGGRTPRNFSLDPGGAFLLSSNQDTEEVAVHRIDRATGRLTATGARVALANPGSIAFVRRAPR